MEEFLEWHDSIQVDTDHSRGSIPLNETVGGGSIKECAWWCHTQMAR